MKGNPILRIALILCLLLAVFWPVLKVTKSAGMASSPKVLENPRQQDSITSTLSVTLLLHTAPAPLSCSVSQVGVVLLTETNRIAPGEYRAAVSIKKGEDLLISADWKDGDPHALRAEVLVHGYQAPLEKSFWAQEKLEDTLPIPDFFLP